MTCRDEILEVVRTWGDRSFTIEEVVDALRAKKTRFTDATIRTEIGSRMRAGAPKHHAVVYDDFERLKHGLYRLRK